MRMSALPMAVGVATAAAVTVFLRLICGNWARAGIGSGFVAFYFFYIPVLPGLAKMPFGLGAIIHIAAILTLFALYLMMPSDARFANIAGRLNALCIIILVITAVPFFLRQVELESSRSRARYSLGELSGRSAADSPDVWHILLDRYASEDTLRERYGFENKPFLYALKQRGFAITNDAYANYQRTGHSVASTMNGVLLAPLAGPMRNSQSDWVPIYRAMRNGSVIRIFNTMGYETIFAGSWWEPTRVSNIASESIAIRSIPQFGRLIIQQGALGFWVSGLNLPYLNGRADQCFRANKKFRILRHLATRPDQKLVFAHFLIPHPPFVLNPDGSCRSLAKARKSSRSENYLSQTRFANREVLKLIDAILAGPRPAYIILHSDEGPWPAPYVGNEHGLGTDPVPVPWIKLTDSQLREKMGILLAVRDPSGRTPTTMPRSPVQIYPALLRDYFGYMRHLPPSRHYLFRSDDELYHFEDVTVRLVGNRVTRQARVLPPANRPYAPHRDSPSTTAPDAMATP